MDYVKKIIEDRLIVLNNLIVDNKRNLKYSDIDLAKHTEGDLMYCELLRHKGDLLVKLSDLLAEKISLEKEI